MNPKTVLQIAFNKACQGIIDQGVASNIPDAKIGCYYRLKSGDKVLKCAIGQLLSDEQIKKYKIKEGDDVRKFSTYLIDELLPGIEFETSYKFLDDLQLAHDMASQVKEQPFLQYFVYSANGVADTFGLERIITK